MNKKYLIDAIKQQEYSSDSNTKVGCVIVKNDVIISKGYNSLPNGLEYNNYPMDVRDGDYFDTKYPYVLHSEARAIVNARSDLSDSDMYVTLFPCNECAKLIIEAKIKNIYYIEDKYATEASIIASKKMLDEANINYEQIEQ